ncbi:MAG: presenilin family intramembrane aspartyl protease [Candidatus Woesearchaeota archaeon]
MKHTLSITIILIVMFLIAQSIGLLAVNSYIDPEEEDGLRPLPGGVERPDVTEDAAPWLLIIGVLIGTMIIFMLIRLNAVRAWGVWFSISIFVLSMLGLSAFIPVYYAIPISILFAYLKVSKKNISWIIKNMPELFIYAGIAVVFAPLLSVWGAAILLVLISLYDMFAVWKSKHMVSLARFQLDSGRFAGFNISYNTNKNRPSLKEVNTNNKARPDIRSISNNKSAKTNNANEQKPSDSKGMRSAILGGGDVAFPLLYSSALLMAIGWNYAIASTIGASIGLAILLYYSVKDRFYPAMPFIAVGCFAGAAMVWIFNAII